jgi:hypothetical protein
VTTIKHPLFRKQRNTVRNILKILWQKIDAKQSKPNPSLTKNQIQKNNQEFFYARFWHDN